MLTIYTIVILFFSLAFVPRNENRARYDFLLLGILLPIDYVDVMPAVMLDLLRYGLITLVLWRSYFKITRNKNQKLVLPFAALSIINAGILLSGMVTQTPDHTIKGLVGIASAAFAYTLLKVSTLENMRTLVTGFIIGCVCSSLDMIFQANGMSFLGAQSDWGIRYSGFSFVPTKTAPMLAIALVFLLSTWCWRNHNKNRVTLLFRLLGVAIIVCGLYLTVGRGGILSATVATGIILFHRNKLVFPSVIIGIGIIAVGIQPTWLGTVTNYFGKDGSTDLTSGRTERNIEAWQVFWENWIFGPAPDVSESLNPHTPVLYFALTVGVLGFVLITVLILQMLFQMLSSSLNREDRPVVQAGMSIGIIMSCLEPTGLFVGLSSILMYFIFLYIADTPSTREPQLVASELQRS